MNDNQRATNWRQPLPSFPRLRRRPHLLAGILLLCLIGLSQSSSFAASPPSSTLIENMDSQSRQATYSIEEVSDILDFNGVENDVIEEYMDRFDEDRRFTESEIEIMTRLLRPSDYSTPLEIEESIRGQKDALLEEIPYFPEEIPTDDQGTLLKPFGYDIFRQGTPQDQIIEDITVGPDYIVGIGDEILISLWGDLERRYAKTIDRQGRLILPDVGVVTAAGKTLGELREELNGLFGQIYTSLRMTVSLGDVRTIQVYVSGEVAKPGYVTLSALSSVFSALYAVDGPIFSGSLRTITLSRKGQSPVLIDLYQFLLSGDRNLDLTLQSGDVVHVPPLGSTVKIIGSVRRPGIYEITGSGTLRGAIDMAGGLTDTAYRETISVDRLLQSGDNQLHKINWTDSAQDISLSGGDEITVYSIYQVIPRQYVYIYGEVQNPGTYRLVPGMHVSDLLFRSGGTLDSAYLTQGELARIISANGDSLAKTTLLELPIGEIQDHPGQTKDLALLKGDKIFVHRAPGWKSPPVVTIEGEVQFPGAYGLKSITERVNSVISRTGGATPEAFLKGARLYRKNSGRIIIDFSNALSDSMCGDNVVMADGDSIYVPRTPETVYVGGAVANPGYLLYVPGKNAGYYTSRTGGLNEKAGRVKIIRVTGEVVSAKRRFWTDPSVKQGDQILVELREDKLPVDWGKRLQETASIIASLATTIYVINNLK